MVPANEAADAMLRSLKDGADYLGKFKGARSLRQLRLYWGLMRVLVDHQIFPIEDAASDAVKIGCGHVETRVMPDTGEVFLVPKSIAFESLAQAEFNEVFEAALNLICERWLVGTDREELREQVWAIIDGPAAIGKRIAA